MAAKPLDPLIAEDIVTDWRLGQLSQRQIAEKRGVSNGTVANLTKGVARDVLPKNREVAATESPSYVYIITAQEFTGLYKIGLTNSIERRLADMQTGCPHLLFALRCYVVENSVAVESMLHAFFHKKRIRGEWFGLNDTDLSYIDDAMMTVDEVINGKH